MKSTIRILTGWTLAAFTGVAQEIPLPDGDAARADIESLGESLFLSEPVRGSDNGVAEPVDDPVSLVMGGTAARRSRWRIEPHLQVKGAYDDNIFILPENPIGDYVLNFAPGIALGFWNSNEARERFLDYRRGIAVADRSEGNFVAVDYTAILLGFARAPELNTVNHDARFDARWERGKVELGASVHFAKTLQADADPGRLVILKSLSAAITSRYQLGPKTALGFGFYNQVNDPQGVERTDEYVRTVEWRGEGFADYAATPRVRFGFGAAWGILEVDSGSNQTFERILARAAYFHSEKLDVEFRGGAEFRQSASLGDQAYPIFDFRSRWTPAAGTRIGVNAFRDVNKSIDSPETDYLITGVAVTYERVILGGLLFSLSGGYQIADYVGEKRTDHSFVVNPGLAYPLGTWGSIGVNYEYQRNNSTRRQSRFVVNRVGVEMTMKY